MSRDPASEMGIGISCQGVSRVYSDSRGGTLTALDDVTFHVDPYEFVCIVGPSGCGKSTLLRIVAGLIEPTSGRVSLRGTSDIKRGRPPTDLVFQEHSTFPWMTVLDNVAFGLEVAGVGRDERRERARAFAERVGLASFAHSYPHELSVGMRQRVAVARAFLSGAPGLLMDEPFGSLDPQTKRVLQTELLRLWERERKLILYVTHDIEEALLLGDRVLVMTGRPGRILEEIRVPMDRPRDVWRPHPQMVELKWHILCLLEAQMRAEQPEQSW
jgi:NitT/TauT family transport system ATP-binding protein